MMPLAVMNISSSASSTALRAMTLPFRSVVLMLMTPLPPRRWSLYSSMSVLLPKPFSQTVRTFVGARFVGAGFFFGYLGYGDDFVSFVGPDEADALCCAADLSQGGDFGS